MRVYLVAPSPLARGGLETLLAGPGVSIVGRAASLESVVAQILDSEPDAVVLDTSGDNSDSLLEELAASNLAKETTVILLSDRESPGSLAGAIRAGVRAILPAQITSEQLLAALHAAVEGLVILHPEELNSLLAAPSLASSPLAELMEALTPREREVLQMLASGLVNKEIAAKLSISEHTVKFHVASILGKLGASTRTEAVSLGIRRGLVLL